MINRLLPEQKDFENKSDNGTIVIVECWFQSNGYHKLWQRYLQQKGYKTFLLSYTNMDESFESTAATLNSDIARLMLKDFTLVGISTGAILCLEYLTKFNKWQSIKNFISVGGPLKGTPMAFLVSFARKGRDMVPSSKYIRTLQERKIPKNKMATLSASHDELIPLKNSMLDGIPSYIIQVYGHNFFHLDHKKTYDLIASLAQNGIH